MSISGEFGRYKFGCATLADVLYELGSLITFAWNGRELPESIFASQNGAINVYGRHYVFMATVGSWGDVYRIKKV